MDKSKLDDLKAFESAPSYSELERLALKFAVDLTQRLPVGPDVFQKLRSHLSDREIVELTFTVAAANFSNLFNLALGTDLEG